MFHIDLPQFCDYVHLHHLSCIRVAIRNILAFFQAKANCFLGLAPKTTILKIIPKPPGNLNLQIFITLTDGVKIIQRENFQPIHGAWHTRAVRGGTRASTHI